MMDEELQKVEKDLEIMLDSVISLNEDMDIFGGVQEGTRVFVKHHAIWEDDFFDNFRDRFLSEGWRLVIEKNETGETKVIAEKESRVSGSMDKEINDSQVLTQVDSIKILDRDGNVSRTFLVREWKE